MPGQEEYEVMNIKKRVLRELLFFMALFVLSGSVPFAASEVYAASAQAKFSDEPLKMVTKVGKSTVRFTFQKRKDLTGYLVYQSDTIRGGYRRAALSKSRVVRVKGLLPGKTYYFKARGYKKADGKVRFTRPTKAVAVSIPQKKGKSTLKKLLTIGMKPVGSTMYIWGGGWNEADNGAGTEAVTMGVSPRWRSFYLRQNASYNYQNTRYQIHDGLDCSGFVGWCIYNVMNTEDGKEGYVMYASEMCRNFAGRGWGSYRSSANVTDHRAGDIMCNSGHVWIVVGSCQDGSVVILHSSPPGVILCGTPSRVGNTSSEAVLLAQDYMKTHYPDWYAKFPNCTRDYSYLTSYNQMRWDLSGRSVMTDPDGFADMSAGEILKSLG